MPSSLLSAASGSRRVAIRVIVVVVVTVLGLVGSSGAAAADTGPWQWPLAPTPEVVRPAQLPAEPWLPGHRGVDLAAAAGSPVLAAGAGTVSFAGVVVDRGVVVVTHGALRTTYEPVDPLVARGDAVVAGAPLGVLSAAPVHCAPRSCLHWGLRRGEVYLDPLLLIRPGRARLLPVWQAPALAPPGASPDSTARVGNGAVGRGLAGPGLAISLQPAVLAAATLAGVALETGRLSPPRAPRLAGRT